MSNLTPKQAAKRVFSNTMALLNKTDSSAGRDEHHGEAGTMAETEAKPSSTPAFDAKKVKKERQALSSKTDHLIDRRETMDRQIVEAVQDKSGSGTTSAQLAQASSKLQDQERRHMQKLNNHVANAKTLFAIEPTNPVSQNWDALRELQGRFRSHLGPRVLLPLSEDETTSSASSSSDDESRTTEDLASSKANSSAKRSANKGDLKRKHGNDTENPPKKHKHDKKGRSNSFDPAREVNHENHGSILEKPNFDQQTTNVAAQEKGKKAKKDKKKGKKEKSRYVDGNDADMEDMEDGKEVQDLAMTASEQKRKRKLEKRILKSTMARLQSSDTSHHHTKDEGIYKDHAVTPVPLPAHYPRPNDSSAKSSSPIPLPDHYPRIAGALTPIRLRHGSKIAAPVDPAGKHSDSGTRGPHLTMYSSADYADPATTAKPNAGSSPKPSTPDPTMSPKTWLMEGSGSRRSKGQSDITLRIGRLSPDAHAPDTGAEESPAEIARKNKRGRGRPKGSKAKNRKALSAGATPVAPSLALSASRSDDLVRSLTPSARASAVFAVARPGEDLESSRARFAAQLERDLEVIAQERIQWRRALGLE
ncbi:hypothetical protein ACHAQA_004149 [Verticillium albo-atrum]